MPCRLIYPKSSLLLVGLVLSLLGAMVTDHGVPAPMVDAAIGAPQPLNAAVTARAPAASPRAPAALPVALSDDAAELALLSAR